VDWQSNLDGIIELDIDRFLQSFFARSLVCLNIQFASDFQFESIFLELDQSARESSNWNHPGQLFDVLFVGFVCLGGRVLVVLLGILSKSLTRARDLQEKKKRNSRNELTTGNAKHVRSTSMPDPLLPECYSNPA